MVEERLVWDLKEPAKQEQAATPEPVKVQPVGVKQGMMNVIRAIWTALCFTVFCGFSFFLGWHMRGWHFSAYYEAPSVDLMGAKTAYHAPVITTPPDDISQAKPEGSR